MQSKIRDLKSTTTIPDSGSERPESLVPPRPNLGPEPWPERQGWFPDAGWWVPAVVILLLMVAGWRRRRVRSRGRSPGSGESFHPSDEVDSTPRQRLIASSERVREALIGAYGPGWASKTTEEIAVEPVLLGRLDRSEVDRLADFLRQADRAKFAEDESIHGEDWDTWTSDFVSRVRAGASSRIIGR